MRRRLAVAAALLVAAIGPAAAQTIEETWNMCFGPTAERSVWACTTIIDTNDTTTRNVAIAYRNRGLGYRARRENDPAMADFEQSIRTDPAYESYISRGNVYMDRDQPDLSLAAYGATLRLVQEQSLPLYGRGVARRRSGDGVRGDADVARADEIEPGVADQFRRYWRLDI